MTMTMSTVEMVATTNRMTSAAFEAPVEAWCLAFRHGFAPQFTRAALSALHAALISDDARLIQGATVDPAPILSNAAEPAACMCPIGIMANAEGAATVGEVEERFAEACFRADRLLGEPTACRRFLNWVDDAPRDVVLELLAEEVAAELAS